MAEDGGEIQPLQRLYETETVSIEPEWMRSEPLNYGSLAQMSPDQIDQIERTASVDLRRTMARMGISPAEYSIRVHWQLVVEGYGYRAPEGYIHPEASPEDEAKAVSNWRRAVEMAADSLTKVVFLTVWRERRALPPAEGEGPEEIAP